jgi:hypothetical protein
VPDARVIAAALLLVGCSSKAGERPRGDEEAGTSDARPEPLPPWPDLSAYPLTTPVRQVTLPRRERIPAVAVVGPTPWGADLMVVGGSQLGVVAVEPSTGIEVFRKPAGLHLAPPLTLDPDAMLIIGDCSPQPLVPVADRVLGCARVLERDGREQHAVPIVGDGAALAAFAEARGDERLERISSATVETLLRWTRGSAAVTINLADGRAAPAPAAPSTLHVPTVDGHRTVQLAGTALIAAGATASEGWTIDPSPLTQLIGVVPSTRHEASMLRGVRLGGPHGPGMLGIIDLEPMRGANLAAAAPIPGISLLASAMAADGTTALAIRLDASLAHDLVALFDRAASLLWVWPLPTRPHVDPTGLAFVGDLLVVFHDGGTLSMLRGPAPSLDATP